MPGSIDLDDALLSLLPPGAVGAWAPASAEAELYPGEEVFVAQAVEKRRLEFASGRACARRVLRALGLSAVAIPSGPHREPIWPAGVVGSLTHTQGFCAAAAATGGRYRGLGIDAEPDVPLSPKLVARIGTPAELSAAHALGLDEATLAHLLFSAKEALYKCQFPLSSSFLGFHDVVIELDRATFRGTLAVAAGPLAPGYAFSGRWIRRGGLILTAAWDQAA